MYSSNSSTWTLRLLSCMRSPPVHALVWLRLTVHGCNLTRSDGIHPLPHGAGKASHTLPRGARFPPLLASSMHARSVCVWGSAVCSPANKIAGSAGGKRETGDGRPCGGTTGAIQKELSPATVLFDGEQTGTAGAGTLHAEPMRAWAHQHAWKSLPGESDRTQSRTIGCVDTRDTILRGMHPCLHHR